MENLCSWVISCCVLHNILAYINDTWKGGVEDVREPRGESSIIRPQSTITGMTFRETLKKTTLETNRAKGNIA